VGGPPLSLSPLGLVAGQHAITPDAVEAEQARLKSLPLLAALQRLRFPILSIASSFYMHSGLCATSESKEWGGK
jgi:hypothetical protein